MLENIHRPLLRLVDRAERIDDRIIVQSFTDAKPLFDLISTENNQIIFGRRGTGKTHALKYLADHVQKSADAAIYLDLREVGSNTSIYFDTNRPLADRATHLVQDILRGVHDELLRISLEQIDQISNPVQVTTALDKLAEECAGTRIVGSVNITDTSSESKSSSSSSQLKAGYESGVKLGGNIEKAGESQTHWSSERGVTGDEVAHVSFGGLQSALRSLVDTLRLNRLWLLLDEWSVIPFDLQPYMADIIRRCFFPIRNITVKFAAIEHRSNFRLSSGQGQYVGLELGSDAAADANLDDFMVFDNDGDKSKDFFSALIFNHLRAVDSTITATYPNHVSLRSALFNQSPTFEEFVRAAEGVPRDAIHLLGTAAQSMFGQPITIPIVRKSAETWYTRDKSSSIIENPELSTFLQRIITEVIGHRKARAFLTRADQRHPSVEELFDLRLLHILKKNISSHDDPGIRYNAFKLDYGCYVNLINTSQATEGLFNTDDGSFVDVPPDDWRSIRRAILETEALPLGKRSR